MSRLEKNGDDLGISSSIFVEDKLALKSNAYRRLFDIEDAINVRNNQILNLKKMKPQLFKEMSPLIITKSKNKGSCMFFKF